MPPHELLVLGEKTGFPLEPREAFLVSRKFFRKDFDRDVAPELRIARTVDLAHPAGPDRLDDLVLIQSSYNKRDWMEK